MIHEFSVSNYFSIYEETTLDLRIPGTAPKLERFRKSPAKPAVRLPSVVVLMGPNGSGKTTLLRALVDLIRILTNHPGTTGQSPLSILVPFLSAQARNEPTEFRVEFDADWLAPGEPRRLFLYELSIGHRVTGRLPFILHEALFHFPKGRPRRLFERGKPGESIYVSREFGLKSKYPRLEVVREDISVIAALTVFNVPLATRITEGLNNVLSSTNVVYHENWQPQTEAIVTWYEHNDEMRSWMKKQMQRSDLAIQDVRITNDGMTGRKQVLFKHRGLDVEVMLPFESGGTKRLFHLLPGVQFALASGSLAILDDIDSALHVDIVNEIVHWFHAHETNPHDAQLFVTAHNVGILDDLEKEELFIVEKGQGGATRVHAAQDVSGLRRDIRLYPKYRSGVLGGLPKIG